LKNAAMRKSVLDSITTFLCCTFGAVDLKQGVQRETKAGWADDGRGLEQAV
jgi:hypothetical protein